MEIYQPPHFTQEEEDALWQNATIVFDTSALCSLYDLTDHYRVSVRILGHYEFGTLKNS